jgi:hypothetical protein
MHASPVFSYLIVWGRLSVTYNHWSAVEIPCPDGGGAGIGLGTILSILLIAYLLGILHGGEGRCLTLLLMLGLGFRQHYPIVLDAA